MHESIRKELIQHIIDTIENQELTDFEELHYHAFNEDYYIIYHSRALKWLEFHEIDAFEAIGDVIEWHENTFGEVQLQMSDINPETIVNQYVYFAGEEVISDFDLDQEPTDLIAELRAEFEELAA